MAVAAPAQADRLEDRLFFWKKSETKKKVDDNRAPRQSFIAAGQSLEPMLGVHTVDTLLGAIARYQIIVRRGGWPELPQGRELAPGQKGVDVANLRYRLMASGDLAAVRTDGDPAYFDAALEQALKAFQSRHGIMAHGRLDERTRAALNVPATERLNTLNMNLVRAQEYLQKPLGERYVVVNIPAAELETVENGHVYSRHVNVVGKVDRPSPEVISQITEVNFNPYWHAPVSIVQKDILPLLREGNIGHLRDINLRVFADPEYSIEVDPSTVNWATVSADQYYFRQEPGEQNAMATVRINFPNKHAVYLHDTPTKTLFNQAFRYDSSGCVRVDDVHVLTEWLLNGQDGWDRTRIDMVAASRERLDVALERPVDFRMIYLTAWADMDGTVHFRPDIYNRDRPGAPAMAAHEPEVTGTVAVQQQQIPASVSSVRESRPGDGFADRMGNAIRSIIPQ